MINRVKVRVLCAHSAGRNVKVNVSGTKTNMVARSIIVLKILLLCGSVASSPAIGSGKWFSDMMAVKCARKGGCWKVWSDLHPSHRRLNVQVVYQCMKEVP